jgi:DNA processing protein
MDENEKNICDLLGEYPLHIDDIAIKGKLGTRETASTLTRMELKGLIRQLPGKMFVRKD